MFRVILVASLLLSSVCQVGAADTFVVATYNINWGNRQVAQILGAIRESGADIVALQETTPQLESRLKEAAKQEYPYSAFAGSDDASYHADRFGFLSKFPIKTRFIRREHGLFGAFLATATVHSTVLQIANVHLDPPEVGAARVGAMIRSFVKGEQTRGREIKGIVSHLTAGVPTIIAGDFNSIAGFSAPRHLIGLGYVDSVASVTNNAAAHPTWTGEVNDVVLSLRIDYVFHDKSFVTVRTGTVYNKFSDHSLVFSELRFQKESH